MTKKAIGNSKNFSIALRIGSRIFITRAIGSK